MSNDPKPRGTARLIADLEALPDPARGSFILAAARNNAYHDFRSHHPTPKLELHRHLQGAGLHDLAARAVDGEYDDEPGDDDLAELEALIGSAAFKALQGARRGN